MKISDFKSVALSVPKRNRTKWILFMFSLAVNMLMGGLIYGFNGLRRNLLEKEGSTLSEQDFGLVFTVASSFNLVSGFIFGLLRDRFGTRRTFVLSSMLALGGSIGLVFCSENIAWQLILSLVLVELGSGTQICVLPVAELFDNPGMILGMFSGAFNVAALIYPFFFSLISIDRRLSMSLYTMIIFFLVIAGYILLPRGVSFLEQEDAVLQKEDDEADEMKQFPLDHNSLKCMEDFLPQASGLQETQKSSHKEKKLVNLELTPTDAGNSKLKKNPTDAGNSKLKKNPTCWQQIATVEYIAVVTWATLLALPLQYYIGSIGFQLEEKGDEDGKYASFLSIFFAASSAFAPFGGLFSDRFGVGYTQVIATALASLSLFLLAFDKLPLQMIGMISCTLGRMLLFACFYSNIGSRFGYEHIGTLVGIGAVIIALVSLAQYPMIDATVSGNSFLINLVSGGVVAGLIPYCIWLGAREWSEYKALALKDNTTGPPSLREASLKDIMHLSLTGSIISVNIMSRDMSSSPKYNASSLLSSNRKSYSSVVLTNGFRQSQTIDEITDEQNSSL